jgi:hypothetical protein
VLLEYLQEDHVLQRPDNVIDFWQRRIDWLAAHLEIVCFHFAVSLRYDARDTAHPTHAEVDLSRARLDAYPMKYV